MVSFMVSILAAEKAAGCFTLIVLKLRCIFLTVSRVGLYSVIVTVRSHTHFFW